MISKHNYLRMARFPVSLMVAYIPASAAIVKSRTSFMEKIPHESLSLVDHLILGVVARNRL